MTKPLFDTHEIQALLEFRFGAQPELVGKFLAEYFNAKVAPLQEELETLKRSVSMADRDRLREENERLRSSLSVQNAESEALVRTKDERIASLEEALRGVLMSRPEKFSFESGANALRYGHYIDKARALLEKTK